MRCGGNRQHTYTFQQGVVVAISEFVLIAIFSHYIKQSRDVLLFFLISLLFSSLIVTILYPSIDSWAQNTILLNYENPKLGIVKLLYPSSWEKVDRGNAVIFTATIENNSDRFQGNLSIWVMPIKDMSLIAFHNLGIQSCTEIFGSYSTTHSPNYSTD